MRENVLMDVFFLLPGMGSLQNIRKHNLETRASYYQSGAQFHAIAY